MNPSDTAADTSFSDEIARTLEVTEQEISRQVKRQDDATWASALSSARQVIISLEPVPQIVWRVANFVLGRSGRVQKISEGLLWGLKRPVMGMAADRVLGQGQSIGSTKQAVELIDSDVLAAGLVLYAVCRKLQSRPFQAVWGPILDDAILRAHLGYYIGTMHPDFGAGRGMLAGFAGRAGLAILVATGNEQQADQVLIELSQETPAEEISMSVFKMDQLSVAAMTVLAAGCGKDSACGITAAAFQVSTIKDLPKYQQHWAAAVQISDLARRGRLDQVTDNAWEILAYESLDERAELAEIVKTLNRRGHGWSWLLA